MNQPDPVKTCDPAAPQQDVAPTGLAGPAHLRLLSRPEWVEPVVTALGAKAQASGICTEENAKRLVIALTEAITNAIIHGNYGLSSDLKEAPNGAFSDALKDCLRDPTLVNRIVDVRVDFEPGRCVWTVTDEGEGFNVEKALAKLESNEPQDILSSGRGIPIMSAFVDEVSWNDGGRQIRLAVNIERGPEQRNSPRRKYNATIGVRLRGEIFRHEAMARDLSNTGIAFVMTEPLPVGALVDIVLHLDLPAQHCAAGRVTRCRQVSGPYHDIAVKFDT